MVSFFPNIASPAKLQSFREMFDLDVSRLVLSKNIPRPRAYLEYAKTELSQDIILTRGEGLWFSGFGIHKCNWSASAASAPEKQSESEVPSEEITRRAIDVLDRSVFSVSPEYIVLALLVRWLQPEADIFYEENEFYQFYVPSELTRIASAVPFREVIQPVDVSVGPTRAIGHGERAFCETIRHMECLILNRTRRSFSSSFRANAYGDERKN